jgi:acetylornithine aminotransferase
MKNEQARILWYPGNEILISDIVRADNCHLWDSSGKKYVDLESGVWCTSIGHNHPRVIRAITEQVSQIVHNGFNYSSPVVADAVQRVLSLPGFDDGAAVLLCSGSEAVEYGVRVAQSLAERPKLMTMHDSYFGAYGSAARRESREWYSFDWSACIDCDENVDCDEQCEPWARIPFGEIGGFLLEPGSSSGLVRFPPRKLITRIVEKIRADGGLIMVNEVTTGVGRTGWWFGFQHYDFMPDIVAMGKGIGNGYPVAVAAFNPAVAKRLAGQPLKYAQSHQNDPLGAAVLLAVVAVIKEEGLIEKSKPRSVQLLEGLNDIAQRSERIREIRGRGLMTAIEFHDGPDFIYTTTVHHELFRRGFLVGRRTIAPVIRIDPSLTVEAQDLDDFLENLDGILNL